MLYQLRGSCCSGKSVAVRRLVEAYPHESIDVHPGNPFARNKTKQTHIGFRLPGGLIVLGKYNDSTSGGVEGVPQKQLRELVRYTAMNYRHVVFEGYQCSTVSWAWVPIYEDIVAAGMPRPITRAMNTPWEVIVERLANRTPGRSKPANLEVQYAFWKSIHENVIPNLLTRPDACDAGYVDWEHTTEDIVRELRADGWDA